MLLKQPLFLLLVLLVHTTAFAQSAVAQRDGLVLATYTYATNNRLANLKPLAEYLQKETGIKVTAASYATVQQLMEAMREGAVDLVMINTLGYLSFQKKYPGIVTPLVSLEQNEGGITNYGGCIITRKGSGINSMNDALMNDTVLRFAMVNKASTSGNLVPRLLLNRKGISNADKSFDLYYAGTHRQVVDDVVSGSAILGGCGCNEYDKHADKLVKLAEFNDIPLGPIVHRNGLSASMVLKMEAALLKVHEQKPEVFRNFCAGWTEFLTAKKFRKANDAQYDAFRSLFGNNELLWKLLDE
jgi:phosphonate transport system substrate-binding protein